ncbi:hypothetical protein MKW98_020919 [Papaver atlanticum]|uniref:Aminoacyl-tRNA synthetase class II (D/K/N) domain-containing protein n=1 Tax=Papaver atlanticum TaxID=357466 RepID=A0AAD4TDI5_9MAGN|nr:hypothetical protein MKW98_020919 [Papaver atlanticum]
MEADPLSENYGEVVIQDLQSKLVSGRSWTEVRFVNGTLKDKTVLVRGQIQTSRRVGKNSGFLVLKEKVSSIQCVLSVADTLVSRQMVKFATSLSTESNVHIEGIVSVPDYPIKRATQQVELQVRKIYCIDKALFTHPFNKDQQAGKQVPPADLDSHLNFRVLDYLLSEGFLGLHTPNIITGSNKGGACLTQSPQLHKQVAICWGFGNFEIGSVNLLDKHLRYPFSNNTTRALSTDPVQMLKEAGVKVNPLGDLNIRFKRKLGKLVLEKYGTGFYIFHRYPTAVRPFYTMPCYDNPTYSNSFDVFIRGEEIISGGQHVHDPEILTTRAESCGIDLKSIEAYIDAFRYGTVPHGGFGVGLKRVVMLFCGLNNIRKISRCSRNS